MLKNYIKIAFRALWRNKNYALINIVGLAIGITGAALLLTYVNDENAFDKFHANSDKTVRVIAKQKNLESPRYFASNPAVLASTLVDELPEVELQTTIGQPFGGQFNMRIEDKRFSERGYSMADSSFFKVFDFEFIYGDSKDAFKNPGEIVLTEAEAVKLFGRVDVLGETVKAPGFIDLTVIGVLKNLPANSSLKFDFLVSSVVPSDGFNRQLKSWGTFRFSSYLVLKEGVDLDSFTEKADAIAKERMPSQMRAMMDFEFQRLEDIHFESGQIERDLAIKGDRTYSNIFVIISIFLLLIASVNYMNLATSKAVFRAKEIGIRKVVGAVKKQLVAQFLIESLVITVLAMLIAIGLMDITMPFFNDLTGKNFNFNWQTLGEYLPLLIGLTVVVALLSGVYPAFFMTRMKTVNILKGENLGGGSFKVRKSLVIFQFMLSIFMIISTLVVSNQMDFIREKNLGFDDENLLVIDINNGAVRPVWKTMRNELSQITGVKEVAVSSKVPGDWKNIGELEVDLFSDSGDKRDSVLTFYMSFDEKMLSTFDLKLVDGDYFTGNDVSDSTKILLNQAAVKAFGLENPVGSVVRLGARQKSNYTVIGVLEDFNFQSLHTEIEPIVIGAWNNPNDNIDYFTLKFEGSPAQIIEATNQVHEKFDNRTAMEYHFLESQLELFYETERQASVIFKAGAGLSIFVACLGLFGLASFTVQRRVKELGIRKVLGASEWKLFYLLSSSFAKQILFAFAVASPLAFYFMRGWLSNFTYNVGIGAGVFVIAAVSSLVVALLTVSYRSIKAAYSNPVDSLRNE